MGAREIYVEPQEMWKHFQSHLCYVGSGASELIAEYPDFGVEIYLYSRELGDKCVPEFDIMMDGDIVHTDTTYTEVTTNQTAKKIYDEFLNYNRLIDLIYNTVDQEGKNAEQAAGTVVGDDDSDEDTEIITPGIEMEQRESELLLAFAQFMRVATEDAEGKFPDAEVFNETYEHILAYLYKEQHVDLYRPMVIEYEDGSEEYKEYPYDSLNLDDF